MGRWSPKHSDGERQAAIRAQLEDRRSAEETATRAAAGELGVPPFEMSASQARSLAQKARRERPASNGQAEADPPLDQAEDEELRYLEDQITRVKTLDEPTAKQISMMQSAMRARSDILKRRERRRVRPAEANQPGEPSELAKRLLAEWEEHYGAVDAREPCSREDCSLCRSDEARGLTA